MSVAHIERITALSEILASRVAREREGDRRYRLDGAHGCSARCRGSAPARPPDHRSGPGDAPSRFRPPWRPPGRSPEAFVRPAAAIALETLIRPHPPIAAEIVDPFLKMLPISPAVSRKPIPLSSPSEAEVVQQHLRDQPPAPLGSAATTRPNAAFSSFTASANSLTQATVCWTGGCSGSPRSRSRHPASFWCRAAGLSTGTLGTRSWPDADSWIEAIRNSRPAFQQTVAG